MKKEVTVSKLLGLTEQKIATLLRINRSQWSMYESGKRSLPREALLDLAEMLTHIQSEKWSRHFMSHKKKRKKKQQKRHCKL